MSYSGTYGGAGRSAGVGSGGAVASVNGDTGAVTVTEYTRQTVVLATLPANTWTAFPAMAQLASVANYRVHTAANDDITESVEIRIAGGTHEIRSLSPETNLQITGEGPPV